MNLIPIPSGMETGFFVMGKGALQDAPELLKTAFPGKTAFLIADENTWRAAGSQVEAILRAAGIPLIEPKIFPAAPKLHPDYAISQELAKHITPDLVPVAVGSGVLNDLTKCASGIAKVPYCCVATAASVDGYTSYGGAMTVNGTKQTVPCPAPYALLADISVLEKAPSEMLASGFADLLTKVPAGAEWLIADALGFEAVNQPVWDLVQKDLRLWVSDTGNLFNIFMGLSATGYAMQMYRDSRPASGSEHMFSHILEMEKLAKDGEEISHGFKVGIGTIAMVQLLEFFLHLSLEQAKKQAVPPLSIEERQTEIAGLLKKGCYGDAIPGTAMDKFVTGAAAQARRELIYQHWEEMQEKVRKQLLPLDTFIALLKKAGAPADYREIGLGREQYLHAVRAAQLIRKRYTILDLLYDTGLFDAAIATLR